MLLLGDLLKLLVYLQKVQNLLVCCHLDLITAVGKQRQYCARLGPHSKD